MWTNILAIVVAILYVVYSCCKRSLKAKKEPVKGVLNSDDFRTWDIKNAKDVEFTKIDESSK